MQLGPVRRVGWHLAIGEGGVRAYVIPPPPARAEQYLWLGFLVSKCGYSVTVLSLPTCRDSTIRSVLRVISDGVRVYARYSHLVSYVGPGYVVEPAALDYLEVMRVASGNTAFRVDWTRCLGLTTYEALRVIPVDVGDLCRVLTSSRP